jgi:SEC-C motif domain protein
MSNCPCCSELEYEKCCAPYIAKEKNAPTAEALMRARYTAYVEGEIDYVRATTFLANHEDFDEDGARKWSRDADWQGLEIVSTIAGGKDDNKGTVEFVARYLQDGEEAEHHEISQFKRENGKWYFVDGKFVGAATYVRTEPKVGRNDPCPCGSGKKFKKCCKNA